MLLPVRSPAVRCTEESSPRIQKGRIDKVRRRTLSGVVAGMVQAIALSVPADFNGNMAEHGRYAHWDSLYWLGVR